MDTYENMQKSLSSQLANNFTCLSEPLRNGVLVTGVCSTLNRLVCRRAVVVEIKHFNTKPPLYRTHSSHIITFIQFILTIGPFFLLFSLILLFYLHYLSLMVYFSTILFILFYKHKPIYLYAALGMSDLHSKLKTTLLLKGCFCVIRLLRFD